MISAQNRYKMIKLTATQTIHNIIYEWEDNNEHKVQSLKFVNRHTWTKMIYHSHQIKIQITK